MNVLLFSLPGSPVLYYGDEIGMGDNHYLGDRDGVRTPMQWSPDKNAGFSQANPQRLYLPTIIDSEYHYEAVNVETQARNRSSLLSWTRQLISLRKAHKAFSRGDMHFVGCDNAKVLVLLRRHEGETVLMVANLSRHAQAAELDLAGHGGCTPEDLFGHNRFPVVADTPYVLTLGPYGYYLFRLAPPQPSTAAEIMKELPTLKAERWERLLDLKPNRVALERRILPGYLREQRWFGGKAREIRQVSILEWPVLGKGESSSMLLLIEVQYYEGLPELYIMPVACIPIAAPTEPPHPGALALAEFDHGWGHVTEAAYSPRFWEDLLAVIAGGKKIDTRWGRFSTQADRYLKDVFKAERHNLAPRLLGAEQSNTSALYGDRLILKLFRRTEPGIHPDLEMVRFLSEAGFPHIPAFAGALEYQTPDMGRLALGLMQRFVPNQGDAWEHTLEQVRRYYERVLSRRVAGMEPPPRQDGVLEAAHEGLPPQLMDILPGETLETASLIGRRTGEMHLALLSDERNPAFAPESFSLLYQRSLFQSMRNLVSDHFRTLRKKLPRLPERVREEGRDVLVLEWEILSLMRNLTRERFRTVKTRIHGDYHLGQVLQTGKDFVIFDFEGEPARSMGERRLKRSPLRDAAGMIRSYHYAAFAPLLMGAMGDQETADFLSPWADIWHRHVAGTFLRGYLDTVAGTDILPEKEEHLGTMLTAFLLEKAVYEIGYEMNTRPDWLHIPLRGLKHLCGV